MEGDASSHALQGSYSPIKERSESEDEDDEDVDFNPFLLNTPSPEASSGLSSESDGVEEENETVMCSTGSLQGIAKRPLESNTMDESEEEEGNISGNVEKEKSLYDEQDKHPYNLDLNDVPKRSYLEATPKQDESFYREGTEARCQTSLEQTSGDFAALSNISGLPRNDDSGMETPLNADPNDEEQVADAICRRTRARYSLADLSLDELETFLQESDEEDYFQNVDDEEEYRKFVAAVQGSWKMGFGADMGEDNGQGGEDEDEEDEEDDYDFEIELEEALESDYEEMPKQDALKRKGGCLMDLGHREAKRTRMDRPLGSARIPLRPLLPSTSYQESDANWFLQEARIKGRPGNSGFTPCQKGQLQSLMHEHVQLLVQTFCITAWDPSQQEIAMDTQRLLLQLAEARERVLSWKRSFLPEICCCPRNTHASTLLSYPATNPCQPCHENQAVNVPSSQEELACQSRSYSGGGVERGSCPGAKAQAGSLEETNKQRSSPSTTTVLSLLDIAQLSLVKGFLSDMVKAMDDLNRQRLKNGSDSVRVPLFLLPMTPNHVVTPPAPFQRKRTMAGVLVQDTKLNGIVLVPNEICAVASRFIPFFNPNMFPYKPPPAALAKRLLFSEAEDELLAMGLMRYNTNWEKIQEHFLPCKTTHQIYVRQKNRSTARAPENSIKAVRRLKMSPLTKEERLCIEEGLKVYKNDWTKVWENCVPYRDPTTLSRLWRAAFGIQKSYAANAEAKEKHRMSEKLRRRKLKEKDEGKAEELISEEDACEGAYLHEAFLTDSTTQEGSSGATDAPPPAEAMCELPSATTSSGMPMDVLQNAPTSLITNIHMPEGNPLAPLGDGGRYASLAAGTLETRSRKPKRKHRSSWTTPMAMQMVKLAPGLPSLNLPPCVRVIRQSKFNQFPVAAKASHVFVQSSGLSQSHMAVSLHQPSPAYSAGISGRHTVSPNSSQLPGLHIGNASCRESVKDSTSAKMHPLLMQTTFETAVKNKIYTPGTSVTDSPFLHNVPRFRPFLPASKGKSMQEWPVQVLVKPRAGELHPFLQREEAEHQARSARAMAVPTSTNFLNVGFAHRPSVPPDSVIRPQPRRALQVHGLQHRELCAAIPNKRKEVGSKISNDPGGKGRRKRSCGRKNLGRTGNLGSCKEREEELAKSSKEEENIVMEQEELCDSEEEMEELVHFECEEIYDSETESSGQEKHVAELHKGDEGIEFEEEEIGSDDGD